MRGCCSLAGHFIEAQSLVSHSVVSPVVEGGARSLSFGDFLGMFWDVLGILGYSGIV